MRYRITHTTTYRYSDPVSVSYNLLHLGPRETEAQRITDSQLHITPKPASLQRHADYFGNHEVVATVQQPHRKLTVTATTTIERTLPPLPGADAVWTEVRNRLLQPITEADREAQEFAYASRHAPTSRRIGELAGPFLTGTTGVMAACDALTKHIFTTFRYDPAATDIATPVTEVLENQHGVCQDFAHVAIASLRAHGLAARYVSGYLETDPPPGKEKMRGADASHAWFQIYVPDSGWVDYDPTNGVSPGDRHVTCAFGRDFADVTPTRGVILGGGDAVIDVEVDVDRV